MIDECSLSTPDRDLTCDFVNDVAGPIHGLDRDCVRAWVKMESSDSDFSWQGDPAPSVGFLRRRGESIYQEPPPFAFFLDDLCRSEFEECSGNRPDKDSPRFLFQIETSDSVQILGFRRADYTIVCDDSYR
jgi:hypothetical protein